MKDEKITRVLLVEDDEVTRIVTERFLRSKGYMVETAINGQKALVLLGNETYDIVLMDIILPKIGGFHLARQMKKNSRTQNIPIIAISAYLELEDLENSNTKEMDAFLSKPIKPEELLEAIVQLTSSHQPELDWSGLLTRTDGEMDFIKEVAELFCHNSRGLIAEIEKSPDYDYIGNQAHRLKGSAATAGAVLVVEMAARIQKASENRDIQEIKANCATFTSILENYIKCLADKGITLTV